MSASDGCTVTSENIDKIEDLVALGLGLGVQRFHFREVFYYPDSDVVDHSRMPGLLLADGAFAAMQQRIRAGFEGLADLIFVPNAELNSRARSENEESNYSGQRSKWRMLWNEAASKELS